MTAYRVFVTRHYIAETVDFIGKSRAICLTRADFPANIVM